MRTHSRPRRIAKWTGTAAIAAILGLYMLNTGCLVQGNTRDFGVMISRGGMEFYGPFRIPYIGSVGCG
jgi:hypothetical protein